MNFEEKVKMTTIDIGLPVSIARMLIQKIGPIVPDATIITRRVQEEEVEPHSGNPDEIPDLTTTHQISILRNRDRMAASGLYETNPGRVSGMREELVTRGFEDPSGLFTTVCVVPVVLIYHREVQNPPVSWEDLLDPRWEGKIHVPSPVILKKLLTMYGLSLFQDRAERLFRNVVFDGLPIDVNQKVNAGIYDIGVVSLPFARASRAGNVTICWPREGALALPQVMIQKKGVEEQVLPVCRYLLSEEAQQYLSDIGCMVPVNPSIPVPREAEENNLTFYWKGWDWFIGNLQNV